MSATNRYFNTQGWGFTPSGGSLTNITSVNSADIDEGISTKKESADGDLYPTVSVTDWVNPTITLKSLNAQAASAVAAGVKGILTGTILDAYNRATVGGGGVTVTLTNAQIEGRSKSHPHRDYGTQTLTFGAISADGVTTPLAYTNL